MLRKITFLSIHKCLFDVQGGITTEDIKNTFKFWRCIYVLHLHDMYYDRYENIFIQALCETLLNGMYNILYT